MHEKKSKLNPLSAGIRLSHFLSSVFMHDPDESDIFLFGFLKENFWQSGSFSGVIFEKKDR